MRKFFTAAAVGLSAVAAVAVTAATASTASAAPVPSAQTHISNTGDSGSNGNVWAIDAYTRTFTVTETGVSDGIYSYTAHVSDKGTFKTVKGAEDPNSTGTEQNAVTGAVTGSADYSFTANALPSPAGNLGVPASITRTGAYESNDPIGAGGVSSLTPDDAGTSYWYALAFPSGTTFGGTGIGAYSWVYKTGCETWTDASDVTAPNSGNITGKVCASKPSPAPSVKTGYVHSDYAYSLVLDNKDAHWADGNVVQAWTKGASGGEDQQVRFTGGKLEFVHNGATWAITSVGSGKQAVIETPGDGVGDQTVKRVGSYYEFANGTVLDLSGFRTTPGTAVLTYPRKTTGDVSNQLWSLP